MNKSNKYSQLQKSPLGDLGVGVIMHFGAIPILFEFAKQLRDEQTEAEKFLWNQLSNIQLGVRFRRQHPVLFFCSRFLLS